MSRRAPVLAVLVAALSVLSAGCASIPGSSRPQVISESIPASPPPVDGDPRFDAIVPRAGEQPEDIVRDYLAVGGSFERKHARARAYLAEDSAKKWDDNSGAIILEDSVYLDVRKGGQEVSMRAQQRGRLDANGTYLPNAAPYPYTFQLEKNRDGQWRILDPPAGVFVRAATFEDVYRPYNVYFLDDTRTRVVPDVRWLAAAQDLPSTLVAAFETGASPSLKDAVRNDLSAAKLQSNVVQDRDRMQVYLTGLGDRSNPITPSGFAQLVYTLNQFGVGGVEVYSDGQPLQPRGADQPLQRLSDFRSFDPGALPATAPGYFVRNGAVWTTAGTPAPGPAGQGDYGARSVAVSADQRWMAVVGRGSGGRPTLFVGRAGRPLRAVLTGASLSPPSWLTPAAEEVWTVRNGTEVVLVPTRGAATPVVVPALDRIGPVRALRLSRDGTRLALVAGPAGRERLYISVVNRQASAAWVPDPVELDVGEGPVTDVSWSGALDLVALVRGGEQDSALYALRVDGVTAGRLVSTSGLPGPPSAVAAAPSLPMLTVAAGTVWRTLASDEPWTRVSRDGGAGSAPAYPG